MADFTLADLRKAVQEFVGLEEVATKNMTEDQLKTILRNYREQCKARLDELEAEHMRLTGEKLPDEEEE